MAQEQTSSSSWQDGIVNPQKAVASIATSQPASPAASSPAAASPAATSNWQDGLVGRKSTGPQYELAGPSGPTTIGPHDTSAWDRIKNLFSHIPAVNPLVSPDQERLIAPEELMTPAEKEQHPILTATGEVAGGLTSPESAAIIAGTGGLGTLPGAAGKVLPRLVSLGFSASMVHGAYERYGAFRDAMDRGDDNAAYYQLTHGVLTSLLAGLAGLHAGGYTGDIKESQPLPNEPAANVEKGDPLTPAEHSYVQATLQANLQHAVETGNHIKVADTMEAAKEYINATNAGPISERGLRQVPQDAGQLEGQPIGQLGPGDGSEGPRSDAAPGGGEEAIRHDTGTTGGERAAQGDSRSAAEPEANGGPSASIRTYDMVQKELDALEEQQIARGIDTSSPDFDTPEMLRLYAERDAIGEGELKQNIRELQDRLARVGIVGGEAKEVLDSFSLDPDKTDAIGQYFAGEYSQRQATENLKDKVDEVSIGLAVKRGEKFDDIRDISEQTRIDAARAVREVAKYFRGEAPANASRLEQAKVTGPAEIATLGAVSSLYEAETGQPLDLSDRASEIGNGSVMDRPPAISQLADRELANGGITVMRPGKDLGIIPRYLGSLSQQAARLDNPTFQSLASKVTEATIALARNGRDAIDTFRKGTRNIVSPSEWREQVVPLLNNPDVGIDNLDPSLPQNIRQAYANERTRLDNDRLDIIAAKRKALMLTGQSADQAAKNVPDDWGIKQGYYHHAFPGNWTIMARTPEGELEPIDTGWRQITFDAAHDKAKEYLASNPDAQLVVKLDNITMPGRAITDRNRLLDLANEVKAASTLIYNGANPDGVLADLKDAAGRAAYGPRPPAQRLNPAILQREANLPGWANDIDNYERYIMGIERYKVMAPARQDILADRNMIAQSTGMPTIQRISEMPRRYSGQYANMLGRSDASIEALEGYPTGFDAAIRNRLQQMGYDPNMVDRAYSFTNSAEALLKLGFNPASAGLHLAQTVAATYPVLGEKYTGLGILHAYDSQYADLVHNLGIQASSNLMDIDTFRAYRGGYLNRDTTAGNLFGAGFKALQDTGLWMFSKGVETARRVAAIGAYQKALDQGMDSQAARDYARDTLVRTQFQYSPADAPQLLRVLPRPLTQFRNFTMKMMEFTTGLRGMEVPRFLLAMGLIGYAGLPGLTALSSGIEKVTGYNPEEELKRFLPRASRGVLGMLGVDYTHNIGFADWLGSRSFEPDRLLGPAGSDLLNLGKAALAMGQGPSRQGSQDIDTAIRNLSPEARRLWDETQRTVTGNNVLVDPRSGSVIIKNLTPGERLEMAAGLTPIRVAEERDAHDAIRKEIEQHADKRGYFVDKMAALQIEMMRGDLSQQQHLDLIAETAALGKMAGDYGVSQGLPKAVRDRAREMFSERLSRDIKKAPKQVRPQAYSEGQNYQQEQQP